MRKHRMIFLATTINQWVGTRSTRKQRWQLKFYYRWVEPDQRVECRVMKMEQLGKPTEEEPNTLLRLVEQMETERYRSQRAEERNITRKKEEELVIIMVCPVEGDTIVQPTTSMTWQPATQQRTTNIIR